MVVDGVAADGLEASFGRAPGPRDLAAARSCLFLDVDGTLLEFAPSPGGVRVDVGLLSLLGTLEALLDGALALVSGRALEDLDGLFAPLRLAAAGVHGAERRRADGVVLKPASNPALLAEARLRLDALARTVPGLLVEDKGRALALHCRVAPSAAQHARAAVVELASRLAPDFEMLEGDMVYELKPTNCSKGMAIDAFMSEQPFAGRRPIFVGDDLTDVGAFEATRRHGGLDVVVGSRVAARWQLPDPIAVRQWLACVADHVESAR